MGKSKVVQQLEVATAYVVNMELALLNHQAEFDKKLRVQHIEFGRVKQQLRLKTANERTNLARRRHEMVEAERRVDVRRALCVLVTSCAQ